MLQSDMCIPDPPMAWGQVSWSPHLKRVVVPRAPLYDLGYLSAHATPLRFVTAASAAIQCRRKDIAHAPLRGMPGNRRAVHSPVPAHNQ